jgi:hypothetical protein
MTVPQKHVLQESTGYTVNGHPARIELYYATGDPHAFMLTVYQNGESVPWTAARELLRELWNTGEDKIVGDGDMKFMRYDDEGTPMVSVSFTSTGGTGLLDFPYGDLGAFTLAMYRALPHDYEMDEAQLDAAIERLLA